MRAGLMTRLGVYSMRFFVIAPRVKFTVDKATTLRGKRRNLDVAFEVDSLLLVRLFNLSYYPVRSVKAGVSSPSPVRYAELGIATQKWNRYDGCLTTRPGYADAFRSLPVGVTLA